MRIRNRTTTLGLDQQLLEGIRNDLQGMPTLYLAGKVFTPATLEGVVERRIAAANAILVARAAWQKAVVDYEAADEEARVVVRDLYRLVVGAFGDQSPKLADFGFTPRKQAEWTPEQKQAAIAKRAATRAARKTRGPKAKLGITGATPDTHEK